MLYRYFSSLQTRAFAKKKTVSSKQYWSHPLPPLEGETYREMVDYRTRGRLAAQVGQDMRMCSDEEMRVSAA